MGPGPTRPTMPMQRLTTMSFRPVLTGDILSRDAAGSADRARIERGAPMDTTATDGLAPEDVLATDEMLARPRKITDLAAEVAAFRELSALMATSPARAVQRFLELALVLCRAGSSGLSLL